MVKPKISLQALLCFLLGGLALAFGQGHWPNGWALLLGLVLWIRFMRDVHPGMGLPLLVVANLLVWEWAYAGMIPLPTTARLGMTTGISFVLGLLFVADRWVNRRLASLASTLMLPCGWVAFDLASARLSPGGTWASLAYTFADDLVIAQLASLLGWTGITFAVVWLATVANWIWDRPQGSQIERRRGVVALTLAIVAVAGFGVFRLATASDGNLVRIACVIAPDTFNEESLNDVWAYTRGVAVPEASTNRAGERIRQSMHEHFALVEKAAADDPRLVVWPEANAALTLAEEAEWIERGRQLATTYDMFVGMGLVVFRPASGQGTLNKFVLIDPGGNVAMDQLKATRVPGSLNTKGDGVLSLVETEFGRVSAAICFDLDFPQLIGQAGAARTDLFLAPSNDWLAARDTHARMARLRAIEQGFALVRPTKDGTTLVTDSTGRTRASLTLADDRTGLLVADVPVGHRPTLYAVTGDAFAWSCSFFALALGVIAVRKK